MGHLKYKAYERGKSRNRRPEGHSTLFGINISLNCARDNFLFNGDAHFSLVFVSKFHGPRVKGIFLGCGTPCIQSSTRNTCYIKLTSLLTIASSLYYTHMLCDFKHTLIRIRSHICTCTYQISIIDVDTK